MCTCNRTLSSAKMAGSLSRRYKSILCHPIYMWNAGEDVCLGTTGINFHKSIIISDEAYQLNHYIGYTRVYQTTYISF